MRHNSVTVRDSSCNFIGIYILGRDEVSSTRFLCFQVIIDKISSLSCQKVAYSITSPKIGGQNKRPFFSVIHPNTFVVIRNRTAQYNFL